jgi:hypothetical protein
MSELNFNAYEVEPASEFTPLPNGQYVAVISESEVKAAKTGNGRYLGLTFAIIEGEYANRKVWTRLNIVNKNPDAQRIANGHLSSICRAVGVMRPGDSSDLHNLPLKITVTCKPRGDGNGLTNDISHFAPVDGAAVPAAPAGANVAPAAPVAAAVAGPGGTTAPWAGGATSAPQSPPVAPVAAAGTPW